MSKELNTNMKQNTDCLIETLRLKKSEALFYKLAADRLEELKQQRDEAREMALTLMEAADACTRALGGALWQTLDAREAMETWAES